MKFIDELLNGRVTLLGTTNQMDDDKSTVVKSLLGTFVVEDETKLKNSTISEDNEEEFEVVNNIKDFDVELKLIKEWIQKPKYDVDYTNIVTNKNIVENEEHPSMPKSSVIFEEFEGKTKFEELEESLKREIRMLKLCCKKRKIYKRKKKRSTLRINKNKRYKYHYYANKV